MWLLIADIASQKPLLTKHLQVASSRCASAAKPTAVILFIGYINLYLIFVIEETCSRRCIKSTSKPIDPEYKAPDHSAKSINKANTKPGLTGPNPKLVRNSKDAPPSIAANGAAEDEDEDESAFIDDESDYNKCIAAKIVKLKIVLPTYCVLPNCRDLFPDCPSDDLKILLHQYSKEEDFNTI